MVKSGLGRREKPQKAGQPPVTRLLAKRSMMRGQRGRKSAPTLPELRRDRDRRRAVLASIRAADDVLETRFSHALKRRSANSCQIWARMLQQGESRERREGGGGGRRDCLLLATGGFDKQVVLRKISAKRRHWRHAGTNPDRSYCSETRRRAAAAKRRKTDKGRDGRTVRALHPPYRFMAGEFKERKERKQTSQTRDRGGGQGPHLLEQDFEPREDAKIKRRHLEHLECSR